MSPGPFAAVKYIIEQHPVTAPPRRVVEVVADVVLDKQWETHRTFALEKAELWSSRVIARLRQTVNDLERAGRPARVTFNSSNRELIQGACFIEPFDSIEVQEQKRRRSLLGAYQAVIRELNPDEFELLCRRLIELLGVDSSHLTRAVGDDGIDFYGRIRGGSVFSPKDLQPTVQRQLSIWLVGQAKQYIDYQAGTPGVRNLVGAVMLGRSGVISTNESAFPDLDIRVCDPVFSILVTGGTLSSRAWNLLDKSGVVGIDGELLAAFIADREPGLVPEPEPSSFRQWLRGVVA